MNLLVFLQNGGAPIGGGGMAGGSFLIMMLLLFVVMYFFMIRPQQKKQKEVRKMRESLQKGDKIITAGGIYGTIIEIKEQYFMVEIDNNVKVRIDRNMVYRDSTDIQQTR
ncbi:MAG: preprotein translocase subunit YajC [Prevotellaceae bacterium]|jgi:preprotein translocase subunit YajC|nr:preprotein translocase subunit YajC [Prevotellaceae bacterium]